jgi:saccharopine dehydrogenase-like NADP-dependent oxidoreductase
MRVVVVGGAGKMASGAVRGFIEAEDVEGIILVDRDAAALERRARETPSDKVKTIVLDLGDHAALVDALRHSDACLNATFAYFNEAVMGACLEAKVHYTDLGGLFHWAKRQLAMHDRFRDAGLTAIAGSGSAPGIVNVMARFAYLRLETVDYVRIRDGIVNFAPPAVPLVPPYALDTILNEFTMNPWTFLGGEHKEVPPFSGAEEVDFPEPVGRQTAFHTIHSEPCTIAASFKDKGIQEVSFKLSLPKAFEQKLRLLVDLGLSETEATVLDGVPVEPRRLLSHLVERSLEQLAEQAPTKLDDHKALRVSVHGTKDGQMQDYVMDCVVHPHPEWHMPTSTWTVGFPGAITTRLLGGGVIDQPGVYGGEAVIPPEVYFAELNRQGIHVDIARHVVY